MWQNGSPSEARQLLAKLLRKYTHTNTLTHIQREWHTCWESFALRKAKRKCDDATAAEAVKTAAKVQNKWYKLQKLKWQPNNTTTTTATAQVATATTSRRSSNSSSSIKSQRELGPGSNMNNNLEYCTRYICRYISCTLWQRHREGGGDAGGCLVVAATWPGS